MTLPVEDVIYIVADYYGIRIEELIGPSRKREFARPRQMAMAIVRDELNLSFPVIGKMFFRDHTTVMHAYENVHDVLIPCYAQFEIDYYTLMSKVQQRLEWYRSRHIRGESTARKQGGHHAILQQS